MKDIEQDKDYQNIHEAYQASSDELPALSVDESILKAAHLAVEADDETDALALKRKHRNQSGVDTQPVKRAWYVPLSYVAMLVISLSVVMKLALEPEISPMPVETEFYEPELIVKEQLKQKTQSGVEKSSSEKSELNRSHPEITSMPESPAEATGPAAGFAAPNSAKSEMKKSAPASVASQREAGLEQALMARGRLESETLAKSKKRVLSQSTVKPVDGAGEEASSLADVEQLFSGEQDEDSSDNLSINASSIEKLYQSTASGNAETLNISADQQLLIDELVLLFKNKQYEILKEKLKLYRKNYPGVKANEALPRNLLDWELNNMGKSSQKE